LSVPFTIEDEAYQGPLHLLLALAERGEVDLERLNLSRLAERYLTHVRKTLPLPLAEVGDFLYVGARLVRLKLEEAWLGEIPEEAVDLGTTLRLLEVLERTAEDLRLREGGRVYARPDASPPRGGSGEDLAQAMVRTAQRRRSLRSPMAERTQRRQGVELAAITALIERRLGEGPFRLDPRDFPWGVRGMALFASLELTRQGRATLSQDRPFHDLTVHPKAVER